MYQNETVCDSFESGGVCLAIEPPAHNFHFQMHEESSVDERSAQCRFDGFTASSSGSRTGSKSRQSYNACDELQRPCEQGQLDRALEVMLLSDQKGTVPSVSLYRSLLTACSELKSVAHARRIHSHLKKHGLDCISNLGESMVSTFIKCGSIVDAHCVFKKIQRRTVVSWTALISGYATSGQGQMALRMYHAMREEGVLPSRYTLLSLIKGCGTIGDFQEGKAIHSDAVNLGLDSDMFVCTGLVDMYLKCGSIVNAQAVFDTLLQRDVVSWTAMVAGYAKDGQGGRALQLFQQMQEEGVDGNERTVVSVLQACNSLADREEVIFTGKHHIRVRSLMRAKELHAEARRKGHESNHYVGSSLASLYAKCGSILDAMVVFDMLVTKDVILWNKMIGAYCQHELAEDALQLYQKMLQEGVGPDAHTFVVVVDACGSLACNEMTIFDSGQSINVDGLAMGKWMHFEAWRTGHSSNVFVANALISIYGKTGSIVDAQTVLEGLLNRNIVSYNAMLAAFAQQWQPKEALQLYETMLEEGWTPDDRTFVSTLQACSMLAEKQDGVGRESIKVEWLSRGKSLHAEAAKAGYGANVFVGNTLIRLYGKCGSMNDVLTVFHGLPYQDMMSWKLTLAACAQHGAPEDALLLYEHMLEEGISPDEQTYVSVLLACGMFAEKERGVDMDGQLIKLESLQKVKVVLAEAWRMGCSSLANNFLSSSLVNAYGRCGSLVDAQSTFDEFPEWDVVTWTAMFEAFSHQGQPEKAVHFYSQMLEEGLTPDDRSFVGAIQACCILASKEEDVDVDGMQMKVKSLHLGKTLHCHAWLDGHHMDVCIGNTLVSMYGKCGSLVDAQNVFNGLPHVTTVSWNVMLAAYVHRSRPQRALELYRQMMLESASPDQMTYMCVLQACGDAGAPDACTQIHQALVSSMKDVGLLLGSTLIDTYGKCAHMEEAQKVFDVLPQPDLVSWNTLLAGYARQGNHETVLQSFQKMLDGGMKPDGASFAAILSACSHAGLVDRGIEFFKSMSRDFGVIPECQHYASMVDLLGRAGAVDVVEDLLKQMPMEPNKSMWLCLLASCRKHSNVGMAEQAFRMATCQDPKQSSAYVLMSNIYEEAGMWHRAKQVHELMQQAGARKQPGLSWTHQENELHTFVAD